METPVDLPDRLVERVEQWLTSRSYGSPLIRSVIRNQCPFLVNWAFLQHVRTRTGHADPPLPQPGTLKSLALELVPARFAVHAPPTDRYLLAVCLQPNASRAFLPVATALRQMGVTVHFLLEHTDRASIKRVQAADHSYSLTPSLFASSLSSTFAGAGVSLARLLVDNAGLRGLLECMSLPPQDLDLLQQLRKQWSKELYLALLRGRAIELGLKRHRCATSVLFLTHRALLDELLPSTHPHALRFFFLQGIVPQIPPLSTTLHVDHALVGSELDLVYTDRCKVPRQNVSVTGYPEYDEFVNLEKSACRAEFDARYPAAGGRPLVVFTSQYKTPVFPDEARLANLEALLTAAQRLPNVWFVIKLHPRREAWAPESLPTNVIVERNSDTPSLIKAASSLVTFWSTTALEALLLETPLLQLNATGLPDFCDWSEYTGRKVLRTAEELSTALLQLVADANTGSMAPPKLQVRSDGRATKRAADVLFRQIQEHS